MNMKVDFTQDEMEVVEKYLFRKICKLEDSDLKDSYCYPRLTSFRTKLVKLMKNNTKNSLQNK